MTAYAPERSRIIAELSERPGQSAYEAAWHMGYTKPDSHRIARLILRMWKSGALVYKTEFRPLQGRDVRIFYVAPPGTPRPVTGETPQQAARRRELNRLQKARERAGKTSRAARPQSERRVTAAEIGPAIRTAACRQADPDLFFGPGGETAADHDRRVARAKAVCFSCPIRVRCLEVAKANQETFGVWGGVDFELRRTSQATRLDVAASSRA